MTRGEAIEVLTKRREFLERRIAMNPGKHLSYDEAEAAALKVAISDMAKVRRLEAGPPVPPKPPQHMVS